MYVQLVLLMHKQYTAGLYGLQAADHRQPNGLTHKARLAAARRCITVEKTSAPIARKRCLGTEILFLA